MKDIEKFNNLQEKVTNQVIELLEMGTVAWRKGWTSLLPTNIVTKKRYEGFNSLILNLETIKKNYETPYFLTYKQGLEIGANVRKGEKGVNITFWNIKEEGKEEGKEESKRKKRPTILIWTIFNIDQMDNVPEEYYQEFRNTCNCAALNENFSACENIVKNMPSRPVIVPGAAPLYNQVTDKVIMPPVTRFNTQQEYYVTLFHELVHSTGHKSRLNRFEKEKEADKKTFNYQKNYAREELTAEFGAAFLSSYAGVFDDKANSAAYIQNWLQELKNDKKLLFYASNKGSKAAKFILNIKDEESKNEAENKKTPLFRAAS